MTNALESPYHDGWVRWSKRLETIANLITSVGSTEQIRGQLRIHV
jgi:hypothetical protein